jgi:hypothetical protein
MQVTIERISVREKDARFWKESGVEVAENSAAGSARARPRSATGSSPLTYPEGPITEIIQFRRPVCAYGKFWFICTKQVFSPEMCEDVRRLLMSVRQRSGTIKVARKMDSKTLSTIALVGLVAMGFGMASHLVKIGYRFMGFVVYEPTR